MNGDHGSHLSMVLVRKCLPKWAFLLEKTICTRQRKSSRVTFLDGAYMQTSRLAKRPQLLPKTCLLVLVMRSSFVLMTMMRETHAGIFYQLFCLPKVVF